MNFYCLLPDLSFTTDHYVIDDPRKPAHKEILIPTRILILEEEKSGSFMVWHYDITGGFIGDTLHPNLEEAKQQAVFEYGEDAIKWVEIPDHVRDLLTYVIKINSMNDKFLEDFYEYAVLPEFGIERTEDVIWSKHERLGPDDFAHYFSVNKWDYVLIFRDYDVFTDKELKSLIKIEYRHLNYIETISGTSKLHSDSILPKQNKYTENITGTFVLLRI